MRTNIPSVDCLNLFRKSVYIKEGNQGIMDSKEWVKRFEEIYGRKPSPEEYSTALKRNEFLPLQKEVAGKVRQTENDDLELSSTHRQVVTSQVLKEKKPNLILITGVVLACVGLGVGVMNYLTTQWNQLDQVMVEKVLPQKKNSSEMLSSSKISFEMPSESNSEISEQKTADNQNSSNVTKPEISGKKLDLEAMGAGDYSSAYGVWMSTSGRQIIINETDFLPESNWTVKNGILVSMSPGPYTAFVAANNGDYHTDETGDSEDRSKDRLVIRPIRSLVKDSAFYRKSEVASQITSSVQQEIEARLHKYRQEMNYSLKTRSDKLASNFTENSKSHQDVVDWIVNESEADGIKSYYTTTDTISNIQENGDIVSCDVIYTTETVMIDGGSQKGSRTRHFIFKRSGETLLIEDYGAL